MPDARYEILIPQTGQDIASHAKSYLVSQVQVVAAHIEQRQVFNMGRDQPMDVIVFQAEDLPHTDSTAKQIASYVGEIANAPSILVSKHGKQGIQTWPVRNSQYQDENAKGPLQ